MDLTIYIVTKNNEATISNTLNSIQTLHGNIVIADLGSNDRTLSICESYNALVFSVPFMSPGDAANHILNSCKCKNGLYLKPWEMLVNGHADLGEIREKAYYVNILQGNALTKEVRLWKEKLQFSNPIFEFLDYPQAKSSNIVLSSNGSFDLKYIYQELDKWKSLEPFSPDPYYYQACINFSESKLDEFLKLSEHYMFMQKKHTVAATLNHYYYALAKFYKKEAKPAVQNLILCLASNPLMAEFWCLMGDVHYHLLNQFDKAKDFYENAIILGRHRLQTDTWPMEIDKYRIYPERMIASCAKLLEHEFYAKSQLI